MKKIVANIKLQIPAGKANPAPPIGPALGQQGVNIMAFCKEFNAKTADGNGVVTPVVITVYADKSFTFVTKQPPASVLVKMAAGLPSGSKTPGKEIVGKITKKQLREIAEKKGSELNAFDIDAAMLTIAGTARSMGVEIVE